MLGRIAELTAGTPYSELVDTRFVEPLELASTYLDGADEGTSAADELQAVNGFRLACSGGEGADCAGKFGTVEPQDASPQWKGAWSAGSMVSSARDQAVWIRALVGGDVVDAEHLALMLEVTPLSSEFYAATYEAAGVPAVQLGEGAGLAIVILNAIEPAGVTPRLPGTNIVNCGSARGVEGAPVALDRMHNCTFDRMHSCAPDRMRSCAFDWMRVLLAR